MTEQPEYSKRQPSGTSFGSLPPVPEIPGVPAPPGEVPAAPRLRRLALPSVQPVATYIFFGANIAVFLFGLARSSLGIQPDLLTLGWKDTARIAAGEYWRLVTPLFLHGGLLHIFFNSYALYIIGPQVERVFGHARFVAIYLLSGVAGVVASMAFSPNTPSVGASGAIFGLIGALMVYLYRNRQLFGGMGRSRLMAVIQVAAINLFIGFLPNLNIDNWGHIGGLVGGAGITWLVGPLFAVARADEMSVGVEDRSPVAARWFGVFLSCAILTALTTLVILTYS